MNASNRRQNWPNMPPSTYSPPPSYHVISLEALMLQDLRAWQAAKQAIDRARKSVSA